MTATQYTQETSNGDTPPHYEDVIQQDMARAQGIDNRGYVTDPGDIRLTIHPPPRGPVPKVSNMIAVDYPNDPGLGADVDELEKKEYTERDTQMLIVIREVVRRCTHVDPSKRPTAAETLKLLRTIRLPELEGKNEEGAVGGQI